MVAKLIILIIGTIALILSMGAYPLALAETVETSSEVIVFKVESGDNFWSISREFGLDMELIAAMNNLTPEAPLLTGQILALPADRTFIYRVREGDNLWNLARKFKVSQKQIAQENELTDINRLKVGQSLVIPLPLNSIETKLASSRVNPSRGLRADFFRWPAAGVISSLFGPRDGRIHEGLDIAGETGQLIRAARGGRVAYADWRGNYGKTVILDHGDGIRTLYAHASSLLVKEGDYVAEGERIARMGNTGRSTGPHLHFEILYEGTPLDPLRFLPER